MLCPKCQSDNPDKAKFCMECAASLISVEEESKQSVLKIEGERKHATVLFSDLSGYTAMTEKMDPEDVKTLMGDIFEKAGKVVEKYEGTVERFFGDEIMVLFGVPKAHEDDPVRAIHTAVEIHKLVENLSPKFEKQHLGTLSMHTGINTGLVITGDQYIGKGRHGLTGDTINLAKRLTGLAKTGDIIIGHDTFLKAKDHFPFDTMDPVMIKGKQEPVRIYKVTDTKKRLQGRNKEFARQIFSEMVGRDKEMNQLELQVAKTINGNGSVVNIIGEAGIGKSRLFAEFKKLDVIKRVKLLEGKSISIGRNLPFYPVINLLKNWAQVKEDDSETLSLGKLESAVRKVVNEETDEILPFIATLMGMKLSGSYALRVQGIEGEALEKLIFKSIRDLLIQSSKLMPLIFVMEDLHWADNSSIELLIVLFKLTASNSISFINVFRPGHKDTGERITTAVEKDESIYSITLKLDPLDPVTSETLINNMLKIKGLPRIVKDKVIDRTGGNPFFIEEVIRSFIDEDAIVIKDKQFMATDRINTINIPHTINDVLMARIDRLDDETKNLIKTASVIGRNFYYKILQQITANIDVLDTHLTYLKDIQMIREKMRINELEYIFKHALVQEAAYDSILLEKRKQLHLQVADSIETIFKDRVHEFYGMLAMHYSKAEHFEKAEFYLVKAGEEALRSSASSEALKYYQDGLKIYLQLNKGNIDPEKAAMFEKNIAVAFYNNSRFSEAVFHFDKVFDYWGIYASQNKLFLLLGFLKSLFFIKTGLYELIKKQPVQRDKEILSVSFRMAHALTYAEFSRLPVMFMHFFNTACKFDFFASSDAMSIVIGFTVGITISKLSFNLPQKLLAICYKKMDKNNIKSLITHKMATVIHCYYSGNWDKIEKLDMEAVDKACKAGELFTACNYQNMILLPATEKGDFHTVETIISLSSKIAADYDYGLAKLQVYSGKTRHSAIKRQLINTIEFSKKTVDISRSQDLEAYECCYICYQAEAQILLNDLEKAQKIIDQADPIINRSKSMNLIYSWTYHYSKFALCLEILKKEMISGNTQSIAEQNKAVLQLSEDILKKYKKFVPFHPKFFRMMGEYYWLVNKQKIALNWWGKSIKTAEQLGARPDLSRTYFEIGKSLCTPKINYKKLSDISAQEYLDKAKEMFDDMDLQWDLEQLKKVSIAN